MRHTGQILRSRYFSQKISFLWNFFFRWKNFTNSPEKNEKKISHFFGKNFFLPLKRLELRVITLPTPYDPLYQSCNSDFQESRFPLKNEFLIKNFFGVKKLYKNAGKKSGGKLTLFQKKFFFAVKKARTEVQTPISSLIPHPRKNNGK